MNTMSHEFSSEEREQAIRLVLDKEKDYPSRWDAITSVASTTGCSPTMLSNGVEAYKPQSNILKWAADLSPYEGPIPKIVKNTKTYIQFCVGIFLILILTVKGMFEICQTLEVASSFIYGTGYFDIFFRHVLGIHTFSYIAAALAISAGLDLGYMLFTDGPDEALVPLLLCISSAAVYTISNQPERNWVVGIYVLCIFLLLYCNKKYEEWDLEKKKQKQLMLKNSIPTTTIPSLDSKNN
ncbi:hypothetical protein [Nitrospirillum pindoramense]|uniref:Uncharacterized protein n=1 Tax=Nitrospirillum amazonense TaxID=28077 RepID=A0A560HHB0_9PROT|nr:hypothetical protein FBZ90_101168 [Nitrospirillum amazonense]